MNDNRATLFDNLHKYTISWCCVSIFVLKILFSSLPILFSSFENSAGKQVALQLELDTSNNDSNSPSEDVEKESKHLQIAHFEFAYHSVESSSKTRVMRTNDEKNIIAFHRSIPTPLPIGHNQHFIC